MARRHARHDWERRPRRRVAVFSLAALAVLGTAIGLAPAVLVHTSLRDRPLETALAGVDGTVTSGGATWNWFGPIEYRDVVLRDQAGRAAVVVPLLQLDRGLLQLAVDPHTLGTARAVNPEAVVEVRRGGSSLEDILAPWLARVAPPVAAAQADQGRVTACDLEVVGGTVEFIDLERRDAWRLTDLFVVGTLGDRGPLAGWTAAGRLRHAEPGGVAGVATQPQPTPPPRLDRGTIPAAATAVLARDGGWSMSAPAAAADGSRIMTVATHRLPLGGSAVWATRFGGSFVVDGLADVRLDIQIGPAAGPEVRGSVSLDRFALCDATSLAERFAVDSCDVPLDVTFDGTSILVRRLAATSPVFRAEASGRIGLPGADVARWLEQLASDDFSVAAEVDLAAVAHRLAGGIAVRPDVRVTGGTVAFAATARSDGGDRLLELRATARNLEATRSVAADGGPEPGAVEDRQLAWREPFTAWLRARRGGQRGAALRVEEARLVSPAVEAAAAATPSGLAVQWNASLGDLVGELAQVLDLGVGVVRGRSRGRIELTAAEVAMQTLRCTATLEDLEVELPGLPAWRDKEMAIELEAAGGVAAGVAALDRFRGTIAAAGDRLELTLGGGVLVDLSRLGAAIDGGGVPWIRPAAAGAGIVAEATVTGDLAGWQPRLAPFVPAVRDIGLAGGITATLVAEAEGDAWRISRGEATVDRLVARLEDREVSERRIVATATGVFQPASGQLDVAAAEILSATLSLRTGGLSWSPAAGRRRSGGVIDGLRGRVQWQADLGRLEGWLSPAASAWPISGRGWGTLEVVESQAGTNLLVEATGSQVALAARAQPLWSEPQLQLTVEVTRSASGSDSRLDALTIDRLVLESTTLSLAARGRIDDWSGRRIVELEGTAAYDWEQLSRLAGPWTGGRVRVAGAGSRPFSFRGPLGEAAPPRGETASAVDAPAMATVPLPDDWLAATRGRDATATELAARLTRPIATATAVPTDGVRLRELSVETSTAWAAADIDGLPLAAGELAIRLLDGQLALGPFDLVASGGRLRGAPWLRLVPGPVELVVPPGRFVDRVALTGELCDRWVKWLSPVLGHSTHTSGFASVDVVGARLPLADPFAGEAAGQVVFESLEVAPTGALEPLVNLIAKLQSVVDPRVAFGGKAVLMRVRPDPVRVRLAGRQVAHEGLVMDAGQFTVRSAGSVAADGSLAMLVEIALRGDLAGATPVVGGLLRTPIVIPLKGTVHKPQFDARAIDLVVGRIMENTAQAVIVDGLGRGLDAIFRGPQPPAGPSIVPPPQPLTLPRQ